MGKKAVQHKEIEGQWMGKLNHSIYELIKIVYTNQMEIYKFLLDWKLNIGREHCRGYTEEKGVDDGKGIV